jgi:hypothetical protein
VAKAVFHKAAAGQSPHQHVDFLVDGGATGRKRLERQTAAQRLCA